jgi:hypothetical protein
MADICMCNGPRDTDFDEFIQGVAFADVPTKGKVELRPKLGEPLQRAPLHVVTSPRKLHTVSS